NASIEATTNEGAKVIYDLGGRPNVADEKWYQDATDITKDPSSVIDTTNGEYTDCEEVTTPGDTITTERGCTDTRISETRSCSIGRDIDLDTNYLYECNVERSQVANECEVGRVIDVTQSHRYKCNKGKSTVDKVCETTLSVKVTPGEQYKYKPYEHCTYSHTNFSFDTALRTGMKNNEQHILGWTTGQDHLYHPFHMILKPENSCDINTTLTNGTKVQTILQGALSSQCLEGDELAPDGYCYREGSVNYSSPVPHCPNGNLQNNQCITEAVWVEDFVGPSSTIHFGMRAATTMHDNSKPFYMAWTETNSITNSKLYNHWGTNETDWRTKIFTLSDPNGNNPPIQAKYGSFKYKGYMPFGSFRVMVNWYSILVKIGDASVSSPVYVCDSSTPNKTPDGKCYAIKGNTDPIVEERWVEVCN
ncbi:hypothetical protein, partial [Vibrio mediterranei]|uniref:hypothetical protein n=1 Tax=Vibrio mediterranei TaxID=689 RepID=UPI001EFEA2CA